MATTLDLTTSGSFGTIGGAAFTTGQVLSGTGVFDTFLRVQHTGAEEGYNGDAAPQYDESDSHTHSILLADVPIVIGDGSNGTAEGVAYREFLFDANEAQSSTGRFLSLDRLQIWQNEAGNLTSFTPDAGFAGVHTNYLAYDLDAGSDNWIGINSALSSGSGRSDLRILIPDSYFINDAAHRYVTLYSAFGEQGGAWSAGSGFEEWGLGQTSGVSSALSVHKTATVDGGTADTAGEVITYAITVSNVGSLALTGVTVTDPAAPDLAPVLNGAFNAGDLNNDGILNPGEAWQYSASYTVTQADLDSNGGGRGAINNTVTADTDQTAAVSASTSTLVEQRRSVALVKNADVSSVAAAGDVIVYTVGVTNTGNQALTGAVVTDPNATQVTPILDFSAPVPGTQALLAGVLNGDYNLGDLNENGFEDPGETFVFVNAGDTDQNGTEDPGEEFLFANIGDLNANGIQDPGEAFQYYNAGDLDRDGFENGGEVFQYVVSDELAWVDANEDRYNDGDTNADGILNPGETWRFTGTHVLTQSEIDNGGLVDPNLTLINTASVSTNEATVGSGSTSVAIVQDPRLVVTKTALVAGDDQDVDSPADDITYTITVLNDGNMTLTGVALSDSLLTLGAPTESGGSGTNGDGLLDVGETWTYTAAYDVTQADMDNGGEVDSALTIANLVSVSTDQGAGGSAGANVTVSQAPIITLAKTASVPGGTADSAGEVIAYAITVSNTGNMTLTDVVVTDAGVTNLAAVDIDEDGFNDGDGNGDGKLDVGETWSYTAEHTVTAAELAAGGTLTNTASVTTHQGASASDSASVTVVPPPVAEMTFVMTALGYHDTNPNGFLDAGDTIDYAFLITNSGDVVLHDIGVVDLDGEMALVGMTIPELAVGLSDSSYTATYVVTAADVASGLVENTTVATADEAGASSTASTLLADLFML